MGRRNIENQAMPIVRPFYNKLMQLTKDKLQANVNTIADAIDYLNCTKKIITKLCNHYSEKPRLTSCESELYNKHKATTSLINNWIEKSYSILTKRISDLEDFKNTSFSFDNEEQILKIFKKATTDETNILMFKNIAINKYYDYAIDMLAQNIEFTPACEPNTSRRTNIIFSSFVNHLSKLTNNQSYTDARNTPNPQPVSQEAINNVISQNQGKGKALTK